MAECVRFICSNCHRALEVWSDGNPYYFDDKGRKRYAYHPDHENLDRCIGNDLPHLCLACGTEFKVDSLAPIANCPKCRSADISASYNLAGRHCPYCKKGDFHIDQDWRLIS